MSHDESAATGATAAGLGGQANPPRDPGVGQSQARHSPPVVDRRRPSTDRRGSVINNRTTGTGLERRRGPGRRRSDFMKSAEEGEMSREQFLFVMAIDAYKRVNNKPYPTWTEVLEVIRKLGYRKTCPTTLSLDSAEDWSEPADAPAFVAPPPAE